MRTGGKVVLGFGVIGLILLIAGIVIGFAGLFDGQINDQIESSVRLENGTEQYDRWENLPFPLQFKVYVFQVVNPDQILTGAIPIVEEVGPFVYNQYRQKEDVTYDEETDTYKYRQRYTFEFDEELSALSDDANITVLNVPMQGVFHAMEGHDRIVFFNGIWRNIFKDTYFTTLPAKRIFFERYQFCVAANITFLERGVCNEIKRSLDGSKTMTYDDDKIEFSFFAYKNDSDDGEYEISGGNNDINTLGAILSWEDQEYLEVWNGNRSRCNQIRGRDSSIYPPFNNDSSAFDIFNTDICRIVNLKTTDTTTYEGITGIVATLDIDNMKNDGDSECYCVKKTKDLNGELECLPDGFADMSSCTKAPVLLSYPHMLWANETYSNTIQGLQPDPEKHQTFVVVEPDTGTPLQGAKRIQFNMVIRPITGLDITANLTPAVFPLIWVEEGFNLPEAQIQKLKDDYLSKITMLTTLAYSLIGVGGALMVICIGYFAFKLI